MQKQTCARKPYFTKIRQGLDYREADGQDGDLEARALRRMTEVKSSESERNNRICALESGKISLFRWESMEESKTVIRNNGNFQARDLRLDRDAAQRKYKAREVSEMPEEGDDVLVLL